MALLVWLSQPQIRGAAHVLLLELERHSDIVVDNKAGTSNNGQCGCGWRQYRVFNRTNVCNADSIKGHWRVGGQFIWTWGSIAGDPAGTPVRPVIVAPTACPTEPELLVSTTQLVVAS